MRVASILRIATLALSLTATTTGLSIAYAAAPTQSNQQSSPYDKPNFVVPESQIYS